MKNILITGGAGYIGSHACLTFLNKGFNVYILDSYLNSSKEIFDGVTQILELNGKFDKAKINIFEGDIRDELFLRNIFLEAKKKNQAIDAVLHLAGLKSVSESIIKPIEYWDVNLNGAINLLRIMDDNNCRTILFSSSATIYGHLNEIPFKESSLIKPLNPYGQTKASIELILQNLFRADNEKWKIGILRYFNPIGAHSSGLIGERPKDKPENIFPYICQVACGLRDKLYIFGNDWPTADGTCHRDFIHVQDVADAHQLALEYLFSNKSCNLTLNVGTGRSFSVLELINTFEKVNAIKVNYEFVNRRDGDIPMSFASTNKLLEILNWKPERNLEDMCRDGWKWQRNLIENY